uniref:hypothetical protein n=1 Tax=Halomonas sp. TaxID=1486246 RepID=UPI0026313B3A|nr:hypothetical protein [Halomonas sp.]
MKIRYTVPFKRKIIIDDHWEIPMQGGKLRVIEEAGYAKALELIFEKQPLEYAPYIQLSSQDEMPTTITHRDLRMIFVKSQLDDAATFLECIFDIELNTDEINAKYESETPEEEAELQIKTFSKGQNDTALPLSFDMLTRAIMAANEQSAPKFEATFVRSARKALQAQEFINSFRYSFLLIESLYGDGKFNKVGLKTALKNNQEFRNILELTLREVPLPKRKINSDTEKLLSTKPSIDDVINHLVEKRGFYFHGNIKRRNAWKPHEQHAAKSLAFLAIEIVSRISINAAEPIFAQELTKRHFEDAIRVGAKIVFEIEFKFREPEENFDHKNQINIESPGTKVTPRSAFEVAQHFLKVFQHNQPASALHEVKCTVQGTGEKVFDLTFYTIEDEAERTTPNTLKTKPS